MSKLKRSGRVAKNPMTPTITASRTKNMADRNRSGSLLSLVRIFLMILPLQVWNPILMTTAKEFYLTSKTLDPSFSQVFPF